MIDWTALATFGLAVVTVWLGKQARDQVLETRRARAAELDERARGALRGAVAEAVENCRRLTSREPSTNSFAAAIQPHLLAFEALTASLARLELPPDLVAYLIWARGHIQSLAARYSGLAEASLTVWGNPAPTLSSFDRFSELRAIWEQELDMAQSIACLLRAHASTDARLASAATGFSFRYWLVAREGPAGQRSIVYLTSLRPRFGAPEFPTSAAAYAQCSPDARDEEGARQGATTQAALSASSPAGPA